MGRVPHPRAGSVADRDSPRVRRTRNVAASRALVGPAPRLPPRSSARAVVVFTFAAGHLSPLFPPRCRIAFDDPIPRALATFARVRSRISSETGTLRLRHFVSALRDFRRSVAYGRANCSTKVNLSTFTKVNPLTFAKEGVWFR